MRGPAVEGRDACARRTATSWTFFGVFEPDHPAASSDADLSSDRNRRTRRRGLGGARGRPFAPRAALAARCAARRRRGARRESDTRALPQAHACRTGRRPASVFLHAGANAQPSCRPARQGACGRAPPRRACCAAARRCCRTTTISVRDCMDARRVRRPAHHRQHVVPQALFRLARSLQHHPRAADCGCSWKRRTDGGCLTVPSAFEMGLSDCRWIYRLGERTITVSRDRFRRRARDAMAGDR